MKNTGKDYELIVQKVFQSILNQKFVKNINVEHDVTLQGKSTTHQIDVYWEFSDGISNYATIVQAKDYNSKVSQDKLLTFKSVIDDLPGHPKGIFVTKTGYQKGAKAYAEANDILLYELRKPNDKDWEGYIRNIVIDLTMFVPHISDLKISIDGDWFREYYPNINSKPKLSGFTNSVFLFQNNRENIISLQEVINSLVKANNSSTSSVIVEKVFSEPTYLDYGKDGIDVLKIKKISFALSFGTVKDNIKISGDDVVNFILKNVLENKVNNVDPFFNVHL